MSLTLSVIWEHWISSQTCVDITYMYFVCRIFFFFGDDFVLPLDRFFCKVSVGQDENTGSVEKHSYHTTPSSIDMFPSFYLRSARWKYKHSKTVMASLVSSFIYLLFFVCWMSVLSVAMIRVWRDADREKLKYLEKSLWMCQFAHHRSHRDWPGIKHVLPPTKQHVIRYASFNISSRRDEL